MTPSDALEGPHCDRAEDSLRTRILGHLGQLIAGLAAESRRALHLPEIMGKLAPEDAPLDDALRAEMRLDRPPAE